MSEATLIGIFFVRVFLVPIFGVWATLRCFYCCLMHVGCDDAIGFKDWQRIVATSPFYRFEQFLGINRDRKPWGACSRCGRVSLYWDETDP